MTLLQLNKIKLLSMDVFRSVIMFMIGIIMVLPVIALKECVSKGWSFDIYIGFITRFLHNFFPYVPIVGIVAYPLFYFLNKRDPDVQYPSDLTLSLKGSCLIELDESIEEARKRLNSRAIVKKVVQDTFHVYVSEDSACFNKKHRFKFLKIKFIQLDKNRTQVLIRDKLFFVPKIILGNIEEEAKCILGL
ncbi:MAG: hypothetical protein ACLGG0_14695 [Bacteriovoracia bacterium]